MPHPGFVYAITNPAMPGLVKIGRTSAQEAAERIRGLFTPGVPLEFEIAFAARVENTEEVERALHVAFAPNRLSPRREFFQIDPGQAIAILRLLHTEDATQEVAELVGIEGPSSQERDGTLSSRRPNLNFDEMHIPTGSVLESVVDEQVTATVSGPRKVIFDGTEMSLTAATRLVLQIPYSVAPGPYWQYKGRLIRDIYEETYPSQE